MKKVVFLILFFLVSRTALYFLGFRFVLMYDFMHYLDPQLLINNFGESIWHLHGFPPVMNCFLGLVLKINEPHAYEITFGVFLVLSFLFIFLFEKLLTFIGFSSKVSVLIACIFSLTPPYIYFEHFFFHTFPSAVLLLLIVYLFTKALDQTKLWWSVFALCALLCLLRSTFHIFWLLSIVVLALIFSWQHRKTILLSSTPPIIFILLFYLKNYFLFGFLGVSSWFGNSLANQTVFQLSNDIRSTLIEEGKLSTLSQQNIFYNMNAYRKHYDFSKKTGIEALDQIKKSIGQDNFNHWVYLESSKDYLIDAKKALRLYPNVYFNTVSKAFVDFFRPTTRWHPGDPKGSPFKKNRLLIESYENLYNSVLHGGFFKPFGFYIIVLLLLVFTILIQGVYILKKGISEFSLKKKILLFITFQITYVMVVSCFISIGELERMRFMVEPLIWLLVLVYIKELKNIMFIRST